MGKKKTGGNSLGKSLIKDRFRSKRNVRKGEDSYLHTSELDDGYDWGRLNLQSVTEESSLQEFLSTAELAGREFQAEKLNIKIVPPNSQIGILSDTEKRQIQANQDKYKSSLKIPRRPKWGPETSADELQRNERDAFVDWRRDLSKLEDEMKLLLTPYERNLEFWRQLWRVIERSDVVVQIVDARNPLLFRCPDLESYVREVDPTKLNLILMNKADFLTEEQRQIWSDYFAKLGVKVAFFSATLAAETIKEEEEEVEEESSKSTEEDESNEEESEEENGSDSNYESAVENVGGADNTKNKEESEDESSKDKEGEFVEAQSGEPEIEKVSDANDLDDIDGAASSSEVVTGTEELVPGTSESSADDKPTESSNVVDNSSKLLSREELIELFRTVYKGTTFIRGTTTIGLVGYPNVGKSSTINALMMSKKVSVSATPGKTKHFQTLYLDKDLLLCDCPGLVMPSFIATKSDMILNGILPIDQMKDHVSPMNLLGSLIPRHVLEDTYRIKLPLPAENEDPNRPPYSDEILNVYACNRGFMTQNGQPDNPRSSRYLLKDFVNGRLLYCVAPPGTPQDSYHTFPERSRALPCHIPPATLRATKGNSKNTSDVDRIFFKNDAAASCHIRGKIGIASNSVEGDAKPWKKFNKHANKNKREKLRRVFHHLDQQ